MVTFSLPIHIFIRGFFATSGSTPFFTLYGIFDGKWKFDYGENCQGTASLVGKLPTLQNTKLFTSKATSSGSSSSIPTYLQAT